MRNGHKVAACLYAQRESPVPGLSRVEHTRKNTQGLCPNPSFLLTPSPWTNPSCCNTTLRSVLLFIVGGGVLVAQSCLTLRPHGLQPTRLLCPGDFPGKDPGVGCHFLLQDTHWWGDPKEVGGGNPSTRRHGANRAGQSSSSPEAPNPLGAVVIVSL